jgi:uncharacterized protein (UPF0216 family)
MEGRDQLADTMIREEIRRLNAHLPKKRQSLTELLAQETPSVPSVDGGKIVMKKAELQGLAAALPENLLDRVRLPLVFLRRTDLGPGAFTLLGDSAEELAISTLITDTKESLEEFRRKHTTPTVFYKPHVSELVRRFHSLIVMGFGVPEDLYK